MRTVPRRSAFTLLEMSATFAVMSVLLGSTTLVVSHAFRFDRLHVEMASDRMTFERLVGDLRRPEASSNRYVIVAGRCRRTGADGAVEEFRFTRRHSVKLENREDGWYATLSRRVDGGGEDEVGEDEDEGDDAGGPPDAGRPAPALVRCAWVAPPDTALSWSTDLDHATGSNRD